jgi:hypothetical protein
MTSKKKMTMLDLKFMKATKEDPHSNIYPRCSLRGKEKKYRRQSIGTGIYNKN